MRDLRDPRCHVEWTLRTGSAQMDVAVVQECRSQMMCLLPVQNGISFMLAVPGTVLQVQILNAIL